MKKILLRILLPLTLIILLGVEAITTYMSVTPEFGGHIQGDRKTRVARSPHYQGDKFVNQPEPVAYDIWTNIEDVMGDQIRVPPVPFPLQKPKLGDTASRGLEAYWIGHSTVLIELEGKRILTDPMLSDAAFPVDIIAPKRFNPPALTLEELPKIDIAVVSHDHYDHLDMKTVQTLSAQGTHFFVGLGVGTHLERWDIPSEQIHEMDWWENMVFNGLEIHCTPARHYSGRRSMSNETLWTSWVIKGNEHSIFHSGDTGYEQHFTEIRQRLGAIDISFIKIGDYGLDLGWQDIHMKPENSVQAHVDLGASVLFPIHWGTFQLSNHDWDEPINRAVAAAQKQQISMVTPQLGQRIVFGQPIDNTEWWKSLSKE